MKHTTRLTACLLALALTACTAAPQDMPASTTTETAAAPAQTAEPTTETPAVQDTLTPIYTTWGAAVGQDAVYSAMNIDDAGQYYATTIDFSTGEQRILCKKLGCSHTDESCPADGHPERLRAGSHAAAHGRPALLACGWPLQ